MPYIQRAISDITRRLSCCFCDYETNTRTNLLKHIRNCEENTEYESDDDIEEMLIDEEYTVLDHIENEEAALAVIKDFVKSNELSTKTDATFDEIIQYIVQKIYEKKKNTITPYNREFLIYKFFFGKTEEYEKKFHERINAMLR